MMNDVVEATDDDDASAYPGGDDGYAGEVQLRHDEQIVTVRAQLTGHFEPISGKYSWYGRLDADPAVEALVQSGARRVILRTPAGEAETPLSDQDPWGRYRVEGFGHPPFHVVTELGEIEGESARR